MDKATMKINVFRFKHLRNIFLVSLVVAIAFPLVNFTVIYPFFSKSIANSAEDESIRLALHLASIVFPQDGKKLLEKDSITEGHSSLFENLKEDFGLMKLKAFSKSGKTIYSTDPQDIGVINRRKYFHEVVAKGDTYTKVVRENVESLEGQIVTADVVETYVPIMIGNTFAGAFEIYYDITSKLKAIDRLIFNSSAVLVVLVTSLMAVIFAISFRMAKTEEELQVANEQLEEEIARHKRAKDVLLHTHKDLRHTNETIVRTQEQLVQSEKMAAVGKVTAGVSQEVLNLLTIIAMNLNLIIENPDTPPAMADQLQGLQEQADRIAKITHNLLHVARNRPPMRRPLDVNETLQRILGLLESELKLQSIEVELRLAEELPSVYADQDQLQQVILNLLTNVRDAMPKGGRLSLSTETVWSDGHMCVELRVEGSGLGIAPERLSEDFDPLFTTTTKYEGEGTGLGLAISQGIVEAHGGEIRVENVPSRGVAFIILLPLGQTQESRS